MTESTVAASAAGASYLIFLQVLSRALTFALNQILLRFLSPELLGASAQLELYSISVLYFSRESIRVAAQRQSHGGVQPVVNLAYLGIGAGVPLAYIFAWLYLRSDVPQIPYFRACLALYGAACVVELLAEPAFAAAQQKLLYRVRASAETAATVTKCLVTIGTAVWASRQGSDVGVLPFALGQLAFASVLLLVYAVRVRGSIASETFSLLPSRLSQKLKGDDGHYLGLFSRSLVHLGASLTLQSTLKFFLTQSDAFIVASFASLADQGAYALASNYGGLVARMLFQPIEEAGRNLFARLCDSSDRSETDLKDETEKVRGTKGSNNSDVQQAATVLSAVLRAYGLLSLLAASLGPHLAAPLLALVAGRRWASTSAPSVLAAYCYYIPLLAYNGITEAFVSAVASPADLRDQSAWMTAFFAAFSGTAWLLLGGAADWGAQGIVAANCVNMALRVGWAAGFISRYFVRRGVPFSVLDAKPEALSVAAAVAADAAFRARLFRPFRVYYFSSKAAAPSGEPTGLGTKEGLVIQLVQAGAIAGPLLLSLLFFERKFFIRSYRMLRPNR